MDKCSLGIAACPAKIFTASLEEIRVSPLDNPVRVSEHVIVVRLLCKTTIDSCKMPRQSCKAMRLCQGVSFTKDIAAARAVRLRIDLAFNGPIVPSLRDKVVSGTTEASECKLGRLLLSLPAGAVCGNRRRLSLLTVGLRTPRQQPSAGWRALVSRNSLSTSHTSRVSLRQYSNTRGSKSILRCVWPPRTSHLPREKPTILIDMVLGFLDKDHAIRTLFLLEGRRMRGNGHMVMPGFRRIHLDVGWNSERIGRASQVGTKYPSGFSLCPVGSGRGNAPRPYACPHVAFPRVVRGVGHSQRCLQFPLGKHKRIGLLRATSKARPSDISISLCPAPDDFPRNSCPGRDPRLEHDQSQKHFHCVEANVHPVRDLLAA